MYFASLYAILSFDSENVEAFTYNTKTYSSLVYILNNINDEKIIELTLQNILVIAKKGHSNELIEVGMENAVEMYVNSMNDNISEVAKLILKELQEYQLDV